MMTLLMVLFSILCIFLSLFIFIQQGKGDMGIGAIGGASQTLFGGSGGQEFFSKVTWVMGALFMAGALGISLYRTHLYKESVLTNYTIKTETPKAAPVVALPAAEVAQEK